MNILNTRSSVDVIEKLRISTNLFNAIFTFIGLIISMGLLFGVLDYIGLEKYSEIFIVRTSGRQHYLEDSDVSKVEEFFTQRDASKSIEVFRVYPLRTSFQVLSSKGEYSSNAFAQMDHGLISVLDFPELTYSKELLTQSDKRVIISKDFATEVFGNLDVVGQEVLIELSDAEADYESFTVCGYYESNLGSARTYDGTFHVIALDAVSNVDYRAGGVILLNSEMDVTEIETAINDFFYPESSGSASVTPYAEYYRTYSAVYFNSLSGVMSIAVLAISSLLLMVFGSILSIWSKITEGHFHVSIYNVLGVGSQVVIKEITTWLLKIYLGAFAISMIIVPFLFPLVHEGIVSVTPELSGMGFNWIWLFKAGVVTIIGVMVIILLVCFCAMRKVTKMDPLEALQKRI